MNLLPDYPFKCNYFPTDDRLHKFYIPALERSTMFYRATGFFSSSALAIAAAGIARLISNNGQMRLLVGAELTTEDVDAIRNGAELKHIVDERVSLDVSRIEDHLLHARLEALAWLIAQGRLEIKVVLSLDKHGLPLSAIEAAPYFHIKMGLFIDQAENKLAFSGSSNESINGWQTNYEAIQVFTTWPVGEPGHTAYPSPQFLEPIERTLINIWNNQETGWIALDIPEALKQNLLKICPHEAPYLDPLEQIVPAQSECPTEPVPASEIAPIYSPAIERLMFKFIKEAPFLPNAQRIGVATSAVSPWPHQLRVAQEVIARFPERFLFCDEVGLGKTIEVGLVLRQLLITGRIKRVLILAPKSVIRQWQEELYEKLVLNIPRYDDGELKDVFGACLPYDLSNAWNSCSQVIASSQLVKRKDRQAELLDAEPWDLVIVDEAHHARRKDFLDERFRPNRLLELLYGAGGRPGLKDRTKGLYLLTATPMQIHPVEAWDLLKVLGLGGLWGAAQNNFLNFFNELRKPFEDRDWDFLLDLVADFNDPGNSLNPSLYEVLRRDVGLVEAEIVKDLPQSSNRKAMIAKLSNKAKIYLAELTKRSTPLRTMMWRNTRSLLKKYYQLGILTHKVPDRRPENIWISFREGPGSEWELYTRIEEYIADFYQKYEAERKGLGFVMTVYRRRLTSSFYAIQESLKRRLAFVKGLSVSALGLTDDDLEQDDLAFDIGEQLSDEDRLRFQGEIGYLEDFLHDLQRLGSDSKLETLLADLRNLFTRRETVLIFTVYTDTMDYLRDCLQPTYGSQIACYSGRGGERWTGRVWERCSKEVIKTKFREGEEIKILLCTESASEGLNLQTCGVLINYDMPWNPMRVEQRIGRIDRIGQVHDTVWIKNYFCQNTVEAIIYQRLSDRIQWFGDVVGELQPILQPIMHWVEQTIKTVAMMKGEQRARRLAQEIEAIRQELETKSLETLNLDEYLDQSTPRDTAEEIPITLPQLESMLVHSKALGHCFRPIADQPGVYQLVLDNQIHKVTFDPKTFDQKPYSLSLITYGNPLLDALLSKVEEPISSPQPKGISLLYTENPKIVSLCVDCENRGPRLIDTFANLIQIVSERTESDGFGAWKSEDAAQAREFLLKAYKDMQTRLKLVNQRQSRSAISAIRQEAASVLVRTALIELALSQQPDLFNERYQWGFGDAVVHALARYGKPYKALLVICGNAVPSASPSDPYFIALQGTSKESLHAKWEDQRRVGLALVKKYAAIIQSGGEVMLGEPKTHQHWIVVSGDEASGS